jgi:hypothetical protein
LKANAKSTMPTLQPLTLPFDGGALPLTPEQWLQYIAPSLEDQRGDLETMGPWQIPVRYKAPAVAITWENGFIRSYTLYGFRTLSNIQQANYHLEGRVSVEGAKRKAYTSSVICRLPDGKLLETATINITSKCKQSEI